MGTDADTPWLEASRWSDAYPRVVRLPNGLVAQGLVAERFQQDL
jgi:hypothetical protein